MKIELILKEEGLEMYGDIPCLPIDIKNNEGERFIGTENDSWLLLEDFVPAIDKICPNDLDYGDVDYFDYKKCQIILKWIKEKNEDKKDARLQTLYLKMEEYMKRAIELKTGIVIEL